MQRKRMNIPGVALTLGACFTALSLCSGTAVAQDIKIAHVYDKTGPLEAYAKQTQTGLMMGLSYGTGGTMTVNGHKLVVIEKDSQGRPGAGEHTCTPASAAAHADRARYR